MTCYKHAMLNVDAKFFFLHISILNGQAASKRKTHVNITFCTADIERHLAYLIFSLKIGVLKGFEEY